LFSLSIATESGQFLVSVFDGRRCCRGRRERRGFEDVVQDSTPAERIPDRKNAYMIEKY
jgi:hypothetical protein